MCRLDQYAWAAGFFEGEGSVLLSGGILTVRLGKTDEEVLRHFYDVIAVGTVYGPYGRYAGEHRKKPLWVWYAKHEAALDALALMWRWLGSRRRNRAQELSGVRFHVFSRVASELLAQRAQETWPAAAA